MSEFTKEHLALAITEKLLGGVYSISACRHLSVVPVPGTTDGSGISDCMIAEHGCPTGAKLQRVSDVVKDIAVELSHPIMISHAQRVWIVVPFEKPATSESTTESVKEAVAYGFIRHDDDIFEPKPKFQRDIIRLKEPTVGIKILDQVMITAPAATKK